ncbi:MAG: MSHA biogenesis protein MshE, partial [Gammaproteobacteria bacterium]|nr:MSHA biogenesis protein MshE [Gammaproteobacteria bacterium]
MAENVRKRIRIGDLLVEHRKITQQQLDSALTEQRKSGRKLGGTLIDLGFISEIELLNILSTQLKIPLIDLKQFKFIPELVRRLPETLARRYRSIVLMQQDSSLLVGMADPTDIFAFDELTKHLQNNISLAVVKESELIKAFDTVYRRTDEINTLAQELGNELSESDIDLQQLVSAQNISDAPVVKLLQTLFEDAIQVNAS